MCGGSKVIVEKNNGAGVFGSVATSVHGYAYVGAFECGSVVDAVAGHPHTMAYDNNHTITTTTARATTNNNSNHKQQTTTTAATTITTTATTMRTV